MLEPLEWEFEKLKNPYSLKKMPPDYRGQNIN